VGALIIGQAAVQAGLVSPILVIVIAATAISNFAVSVNYQISNILRLLRLLFLFFAALLGLYGMSLVLLALLIHLAGLKSFGVPYLAPLAPASLIPGETKDVFYRLPKWHIKSRPHFIAGSDLIRDNTQPPSAELGPGSATDADEKGAKK
jgi:spore germination protein KA